MIHTKKNTLKLNWSVYKKYEYVYLGNWCSKSTIFKRLLYSISFQKNGGTQWQSSFFVIDPFCTPHSVCLNIGFWQGRFLWKCCAFICSTLNWKTLLQFFKKSFSFSENLFQIQGIENVQHPQWLSHKNMPISLTEGYFKNP